MALSLTVEETNFLRLVALTIGVAPRAVRCYFDGIFYPNNLQTTLLNHQKAIDNLRYRQKVLTSVQYNALFPSGAAVTSKNFDITLMICLLRNISGIAPPVTGYDTLPSPTDISTGADLARIKYHRNRIAHSTDSKMLTQEFEDAWNDVSTAVGRLGGIVFQQECFSLKSSNLDSECYNDILLNIRHSQDEVSHTMATMIEALTKKTIDMENILQDTVPQNMRALYHNDILKWKEEDSKFVSTNQSKKILKHLDTEAVLTITGNSGVGKSFTTKHVALQLQSKGYDVLPVRKPFDILQFVSHNAKIVFIFDDVCGKTHLLHSEIEDWERYSDDIENCIFGKDVKILCNCRLQIFQSKEFESLQLLRKCQINLLSSIITISEKRLIASKYISEEVLQELSDECIQAYDCFPLLCKMSKTWEASKALAFLINPFSVFEKELQQMKSGEKLNLCALLLVTIFNNNFDNELLIDDIDISDRNTLDNILEECGETRGTSRKLIKDHLDTMVGVYLMFEENSYRFANERLFEMTFTFMAKTFLKCVIKHCSVSMLCDKFGLECLDEGRQHYHFFVPSNFEIFFFERLLKETNDNNFLDIFDCKQMNDKKYRTKFLAFCKTFDSEEICRIMKLSYFGIDLLHLVSKRGYIDFALFCIEKDVHINKYDFIGMTPLHNACKYENEKLVNLLLNAGACVNSYKSRGFTALYCACMSGKIHVVKHLLENQADPNLCSDRRLIPLLLVSEKGYLEIAKLLIEFGADINLQGIKGITALHQACSSGHEKIVKILLEYGANVNKCSLDGETPLHVTCSTSFSNIINMLVTRKADLFARSGKTGLTPLNLLQRDKREVLISLLRKVNSIEEIHSMIEYAFAENDKDLVEILVENHTDINGFMKSGKTALHIACLKGNLEIANLLIENKANMNICTMQGETVIQLSCLSSNCDLLKLLIIKGAEIVVSNQSTSLPLPLHIGCLLNHYEMCSLLLQNTVSTEVNKSVELTLYTAYALRNTKYMDDLLEKVGQWHKGYVTPLEIACLEQNIDIMSLLLNNGADPNICFHSGSFPLALACIFEDEKMVELLLNNQSNVNTFTDIDDICTAVFQCGYKVDIVEKIAYKRFDTPTFPLSALHIASISNNSNIVQMLLNSKANPYEKCSISPMVLNVLSKKRKGAERHEIAPRGYSKCSIIHNVLPLHIACLMGNDNIVDILIQNNIDCRPYYTESSIELSTEQVMCIHGLLDEFGLIPRQEQKFMFSPIQIACFSTHWIILKNLFKYGAAIFESCDISNTLMACFSGNIKDLQNCKYQETVYKTSVENILFEHNHISIIRDLKDLGFRFGTNHINKMLDTFVKSCYAGDLQTVGTLLNIIEDISIIHKNKAAIHYACEANQAEVVELLVSHKAEVNSQAMDLETPIHIATRNECAHMIELLIRSGGDPFLTNKDGDNALHIACMKDNTECLLLILQFADSGFISGHIQEYIDMTNTSGMTPLSIAFDKRNKEILEILILKGADIDKRYGPQYESLLFKSCKDGKEDIVSLLLEKSASTNVYNIDRKTPLFISCCFNYDKITCKLLENNANVNISSYEGYSPLYFPCLNNNVEIAKMLLQKGANTNVVLENTKSLLVMSCKLNHPDIVDLLLQYNADVNYCHYSGETALYFAFEDGNIDIMQRLLNNHADWKVCKHERDFFLYLACKRGDYDLINIIFEHHNEIDINKVIFNGETLLHTSLKTNNVEIWKLLLKRGADINIHSSLFHQICLHGKLNDVVDILNITSVHQTAVENELIWACGQSNISLIRILINFFIKDIKMIISALYEGWFQAAESSTEECMHLLYELGLNVNKKRNNDGRGAIHIACAAGNIDVVKFLLGCRIIKSESKSTFDKLTPLHLAITNGHDKIVRLLIEGNANVNATTASGENALFLACSYSHDNVLSVLYELKTYDMIIQFGHINTSYLEQFYMPMRSVLKEILCCFQVGYSVNSIDTVIHFACRMEDEELLNSLIIANANVNSINAFGETPLLIAVSKLNVNIVLILLDAKAPINVSCTVHGQGVENLLGKTSIKKMENVLPIHLACLLDNIEIVHVLVNRNAECSLSFKMYHYTLSREFQFEELSPVYIAVLSNNKQMLTMLLTIWLHPVSLRKVSIFSNTLIEKNHFFDGKTKYHTKMNLTPFQVAVILGFSDIVKIFIDYGFIDVNSKFNITPLLLSSIVGNSSFIEVLETYNLQEEHCKTEVTPLLYATLMKNCELINILLKNNASVTYAADISLLDIISTQPEITALILTCRATFSLASRCRVNTLFVALLKNDEDILASPLSFLRSFNDSTDITIIHFLCLRGYSDHLKIILNCNIYANNAFPIQCSHLFCISKLTDKENIYGINENKIPWNRHQFAITISLFEFCCLFSSPYVLQNLLEFPVIMHTSVDVTPCLLTLCFGKERTPFLLLNRQKLKSTFPICFLAWLLYCKSHIGEICHHLPDFVVADLLNICAIEDSDLIVSTIDVGFANNEDISEMLEILGLCTSVNLSIILAACNNQEWDTVLQIMNFTNLSSNYIHFEYANLICLRNIDIRDVSCGIPSEGIIISALELKFLICGHISDILFHIPEAKEHKVFLTSAIAACLHNNKRNLNWLLDWDVDMNITYTIPCLHLMCFLETSIMEILKIMPYEKMMTSSLNAEFKSVHVACLKGLETHVLRSLMMKCNVNSFATLSSLHIILLTGNTQYLKEYAINENFPKMGQMAPVHILCFRQNNDGIHGLLHTQCDFNSKATNLTYLHLKFLTNEDIFVHKSEKHNSTLSDLTPLHIASLINDGHITKLILRKTYKTDIVCKIFPLHLKFKYNERIAQLINTYSSFQMTAFHIACIQENIKIGELLIIRNADLNLSAKLFIEFEISEIVIIPTHSEIFPLHLACLMQNVTFTRMISSQVKTINDICSMSVWHICLFLNKCRYVDKLCSFPEYRDSLCMLSPLHVACLCGDVSILTVLLKKGADSKTFATLDAPYAIIYENNDTIVKLFFLYHYKVAKYPLHVCAENGNTEQCRVLLKFGADTDVETSFARLKPWHLALYHGHKETLSLLLETPTEIGKKKFLMIFFMYLFRKMYSKKSGNCYTRIKVNRLVVLSLYRQCLPALKDIVFMKEKHRFEEFNDLHYDDAMSSKLF